MANKTKSIVFVDAGIEAPLQLATGIALDAETLILPPDSDGVAYIAAALQARADATEVFVVAHGAPGQLWLGNAELSLSTLPRYRDRLQQWTAQTSVKDIHFYGCQVAAGDAGTEFLSAIHTLTHANIAASTHLLGHADRGGNWTLDAFWGEVERRNLLTAAAVSTYPGILAANNDIQNAIALTPGTPDAIGNALANNQVGEPIHDTTPGANNLSNDSVWWTWTSNVDGLVNVNTEGSTIGTALAVYSSTIAATDPTFTFGSLTRVADDLSASGSQTTSASFEAQNGVIYYFAVDGTGFQQTANATAGITIQLDVPPQITAAQLFPVSELANNGDVVGTVAIDNAVTVDTWEITGGNPDNDSDGTLAFAIDGTTGAITVNDADDLDFETFPQNYELTVSATNGADTDTESVFVQVTDVNEAPTITSLSAPGTVSEGQTFTLTGQIDDPDINDTATVEITWGDGKTSTVSANSSGAFSASHSYADDTAFTAGNISVEVTDSGGLTDTEIRNISVVNVAPTVTPSITPTFSLAEDGTKSFFLTATDPAGAADPFTWSVTAPSSGGTLTPPAGAAATQFFTYTPLANFNGSETFEIKVDDGDGGTSTIAFTANVTPVADAPSNFKLATSAATIDEGESITLSGSFVDPDVGDTFTVTIDWNDGTTPTVLNSSDLKFNTKTQTYSFNTGHEFNINGAASITATVVDSFGKTAIATKSITIDNTPPEVTPASSFLTIDEDDAGTLTLTASDISSETFTWSIDTAPTQGTASFVTTGTGDTQTLSYTPDPDYFGGDNFIVKVIDEDGGISFASVGVNVNPVNDAPINLAVTPDVTSINEGDTVTLSGSFDDIDNSTEVDLDDVHSITVDWGDGTVETFNDTDAIIFTNTDQTTVSFAGLSHTYLDEGTGTYSVKVTVTDAEGATDAFTTEIEVANVAPVLVDPAASPTNLGPVTEDTPFDFTVKASDVGTQDTLTWNIISGPSNGSLALGASTGNGLQNFTYTPDDNFDGDGDGATFNDDTFTLQVSDGDGGFQALVYNVGIAPVADRPDITVNSFTVVEDQVLKVDGSVLNAIDDDTLAADLTFTITGTDAGSFLLNGVASPTFTLSDIFQGKVTFLYENANDAGAPSFTIKLADDTTPTALTDIAAGNIVDFTAVNDAPVLDGTPLTVDPVDALTPITVDEGGQVAITSANLGATDEESGAANLTFTLTNIEGGDFIVNGVVSTSFTLARVNAGAVFFQHDGTEIAPVYTVTVTDGDGLSSPPQTITGAIGATVNDPPLILVNDFDVVEGEELLVTTSVLDAIDVDAATPAPDIQFTITGANAGSFLVGGVAATTFTRADIVAGNVSFLYDGETAPVFSITANDQDAGGAAETTVAGSVNFTEVNDTPVFLEPVNPAVTPVVFELSDGILPDFTVQEGGNVAINRLIIRATDGDFDDRDLTFTVSNVAGGSFRLVGSTTPVTTFTQGDINLGRVLFVNDGTVTAPSYDISVTDGDSTATATGGGIVIPVNDAPEITVNNFTVVEDQELLIDGNVLNAIDEDNTNPADLTFTITGTDAGSFLLNGVANPTFTLSDIFQGKVTFLYENANDDGEPTFTVEVKDPGGLTDKAAGNIADFTAVNDAPVLDGTPLTVDPVDALTPITVDEGGQVAITSANLGATDEESGAANLTFALTNIEGGNFIVSGVASTSFTLAQVNAGGVFFQHDGTEIAPVYTVTVTDGEGLSSPPQTITGAIGATVNDPPIILKNNFVVTEGEELLVTTKVLDAIDIDAATPAPDIEFTIKGANAGSFIFAGDTDATDGITFNRSDIVNGDVTFLYDGETAPIFSITANDQDAVVAAETTVAGNVTFTEVNDTPVFLEPVDPTATPVVFEPSDGILPGFTVQEDGNVTISRLIIRATDGDFDDRDLEFTVSNVQGGDFFLVGNANPVTTFTQNDINLGRVFFENDGTETAPSYNISVTDGDNTATATGGGTVNGVNDAPEIITNEFAITEGEELVITTDVLNIEDVDSLNSEISITVAGNTGNALVDAAINAAFSATTFTLADVVAGTVTFNYDGEIEPSFSITVEDNRAGVTPTPIALAPVDANITFTPVNDAPTLTISTPIAITEDAAIDITAGLFAVTDAEVAAGLQTSAELEYTVDATTNGTFQIGGKDVTSFTQQDVIDNLVDFVHSGETAPSFTVTLDDNGSPSAEQVTLTVDATDFTFTAVNDIPELVNKNLTVTEGKTVTLTTANLSAIDVETKALDLEFNVTNVVNGNFNKTTFTLLDLVQETVTFTHDDTGETPTDNKAPSFDVTVTDTGADAGAALGDATSPVSTVNVTLIPVNDAPVLTPDSDGVVGGSNDPFAIKEGSTLVLNNPADGFPNITVTDPDTAPEDIEFTASNVTGGFFASITDTKTAITTFTQAQLDGQQIVFRHNGSETQPTFTLEVTDGESTDLENFTATLTTVNDAPEITANTLTIAEDEAVTLTINDLKVVDPESGPANLTYTISNLANGAFFDITDTAFATPLTTFTQQDVIDGEVVFKQGGSNDAPTYTLTAKDNGTPQGISIASDAIIDFTPINDAPELAPATTEGLFAIQQGQKVTIDGATQLSFVDEETFDGTTGDPALLTYSIDAVNKGTFFLNGAALAVSDTFTQQDLNLGSVAFQHDNSEFAPSYTVTVSDNGVPSPVQSTTLEVDLTSTFVNTPDAPTLLANALTIDEGQTFKFTTSNLSAEDLDSPNLDLKFSITNLTNGAFDVDGAAATEFTLRQVVEGLVSFTHDGSDSAPAYDVEVSDGALTSGVESAAIAFNRENDNPTLIGLAADTTTTPNLAAFDFTIKENGILGLGLTQIDAADEVGETAQADLTFEVSNVQGGFFALSTNTTSAITDFTWVQIKDGDIAFKHDGSNVAPAYTLTALDTEGGSTSDDYTGTLTAVNDAPVVTINPLAITEEGTVTIDTSILAVTDEESASSALVYTVDAVTGGEFQVKGTTQTTFTQADVIAGTVTFVDDGLDDNAPTFSLTLTDEAVGVTPAITTTINSDDNPGDPNDLNFAVAANFTPVNDLPTPDPFIINFPTVVEGGTTVVVSGVTAAPGEVQIFVTDEETTNPVELVYTVDSIANANFQVNGSNATTFTQDDIDNNRVTFVHDDSEVAPTFTLSLQDNNGGTGANTLTQTVTPAFQLANEAPELTKNTLSPIEGQEITLTTDNIFASDREDLVTQLTFEITDVAGGTFFLNDVALDTTAAGDNLGEFSIAQVAAGEITFKDDGDETPPSYKVNVIDRDGAALAAPEAATIDLSQFPVNDAPEITVANFPIVEGTLLELDLTILETADVDNAATELTYTVSNLTGGEFLVFDSTATPPALVSTTTFTQQDVIDGEISFQPDKNSEVPPSFTLTVSDGVDGTDTVNVSVASGNITFTPVNDAPVTVADSFTTDEETPLTGLNVTANDTDDSGTALQVTKINGATGPVTTTKGATVEIVSNLINYDPGTAFQSLAVGATDTDTFTYTVEDNDPSGNKSATGTVTITIEGKNDLPTLTTPSLTAATTEGTPITLNALVNSGATDIDFGDVLSISKVTNGTFGAVTFTNETLTYTPGVSLLGGEVETENITFTVSDGNGGTVDGTVEITLTGVNDPPIAVANSGTGFRTTESVAFRTANVLTNDFDPEGGAVTLDSVNTSALRGLLVNNGNGTFNYDPNGVFDALPVGKTRNDTFSYTIKDDQGATASTTVSIQVTGQLSSFLDYEKQLKLGNLAAVAPGNVIDVLPLAQLYDERYYLNQNPDVARLVGSTFSSGFQHFVTSGINEGRNPSVLYNESFYRANNADVRNAIASGALSSGLSHFLTSGHREGRDPSAFFDQSDYLLNNPDVNSAVNSGGLASAFEHYVKFGVDDNRLPALTLFDARFYLNSNPDLVRAGVTQASAFDHFQQFGQFEGRRGSAAYTESSYRGFNPDVANAINSGALPNGFQHFEAAGRFEGRFVLPV
ncbi:cadherin-like domain-containing protein [Halomicronema sp. CCY15110]|uniref:cadherin-like domain-containing protein n=1 Tax=Halomicronema sp. CCY15110 TaxID=2767773 RepID=UPI0019517A95|nr:cadherin-like domain-containing protein [Halomicronema sp. CCY15110]